MKLYIKGSTKNDAATAKLLPPTISVTTDCQIDIAVRFTRNFQKE
jgi:hypothetical protein